MGSKRPSFVIPLILGLLLVALALAFAPILFPDKSVSTVAEKTADQLLRGNFTLAVSWQPAFCETQARLPECKTQSPQRFDASNFSLHGLWPDPAGNIYCDVSDALQRLDSARDWGQLPALKLSGGTRDELDMVMPGAVSFLDRHEWIKHGTCSGGDAQSYYAASLVLMEALNQSAVRDLFVAQIGETLKTSTLRAAFDAAFGKGTGERVEVSCVKDGKRQLIGEIRIALTGEIGPDADLKTLMLAAPQKRQGCNVGSIDAVGLQ